MALDVEEQEQEQDVEVEERILLHKLKTWLAKSVMQIACSPKTRVFHLRAAFKITPTLAY